MFSRDKTVVMHKMIWLCQFNIAKIRILRSDKDENMELYQGLFT